MEEYLRSLQKQLKDFPPEEQAAIMDEIRDHGESAESDTRIGSALQQRRSKVMKELGSSEELGRGFRSVYRPNRLVNYLLVAIPYVLSLYLTEFYLGLRPQYPWMDIRINVVFDLIFVAVGFARRSVLVTLFWMNIAIMQLWYIVLQGVWQPYWYFGRQTILWAIILAGLLVLFGRLVWQNRADALIVIFALLPISMELLGTALWNINADTYAFNSVDRSLLIIFLRLQEDNIQLYVTLASTALFFLAYNRDARWASLVASALFIGFGRAYLFDYEAGSHVASVAQWVYYFYILFPLGMVVGAWWVDYNNRRQVLLRA